MLEPLAGRSFIYVGRADPASPPVPNVAQLIRPSRQQPNVDSEIQSAYCSRINSIPLMILFSTDADSSRVKSPLISILNNSSVVPRLAPPAAARLRVDRAIGYAKSVCDGVRFELGMSLHLRG